MVNKITLFKDDNSFLSNFYPAEVKLGETLYPTVEHAFQAAKTLSVSERVMILSMPTPGAAKRAGRRITLRSDWEELKLGVMEALVRQKFSVEPLRTRLLRTGDAELIEGNWWGDTFWGVCMGKGENHLGKILMRVREELRAHG